MVLNCVLRKVRLAAATGRIPRFRARTSLLVIVLVASIPAFWPLPSAAQQSATAIGTYPLSGLKEGTGWINSAPLEPKDLKGKVILIDFWDYSCINCIRDIPVIRQWAERYKSSGLVVIGVHAPEFDFEKQPVNIQRAVTKLGIEYPVVLDNDYGIWSSFHNEGWPTEYLIDARGQVRYEHFGEGGYEESERHVEQLLKDAGAVSLESESATVRDEGVEAAADLKDLGSPETLLGYAHTNNFASPGGLKHNKDRMYSEPVNLHLNDWALVGRWNDHEHFASVEAAGGELVFRFHARDLHIVMGPGANGTPVRFTITIDGAEPGQSHGVDTDAQGAGVVTEHRLYQLIRQRGLVADHTFAIKFLDPGVQAFSVTFG